MNSTRFAVAAACALLPFRLSAEAPAEHPAAAPAAHHAAAGGGVSAEEALVKLKEGNARFVAGQCVHPNHQATRRTQLAAGQKPFVTILSCSDSREVPELVFDHGLGELFVIRVAGNVVDSDITATAEYGAGHLGTQLLIVLGHTKCGAVTAAAKDAELSGSLPHLISHIQPAVARAKAAGEDKLVERSITENVWESVAQLLKNSAELREMVREGKLQVQGALYDIESGSVEWLGAHPNQAKLVAK